MKKDRFEQLKSIVELDYEGRHDAPSLYFTHDDLKWLIKQAELLDKTQKDLDERIYSAGYLDEHDVEFELENLKLFIKEHTPA